MAQVCPVCGSADTHTEVRGIKCLICGAQTSYTKLAETIQPTHRRETG